MSVLEALLLGQLEMMLLVIFNDLLEKSSDSPLEMKMCH